MIFSQVQQGSEVKISSFMIFACSTFDEPGHATQAKKKLQKSFVSNFQTNVSAVYSDFSMSCSFFLSFFPSLALQVAIVTKINNRVLCNAVNSSYHPFSAVSKRNGRPYSRHAILRHATLPLLQVAPNILIQITPYVTRSKRERALCHFWAARAHG